MSQVKKMILINIITLVVLVIGAFSGYHFYNEATNFINTDNAKIDGQQIIVSATAAGKLVDWKGENGIHFKKNEVMGRIDVSSPTTEDPQHTEKVFVKAPADLTVVSSKGFANSLVSAGTPLAYTYDLNHLYVTANIKETVVKDVSVGQDVDIYIDAFKDAKLKGKVEEIGLATSGTFSLLPQSNGNANYTKVTQVVPVKISIENIKGNHILPGMNVTVRIHK
jgi:multidrug resistance efflux pump